MAEEYVYALGRGLLNSWERKLSCLSEGHRQCPAVCSISTYAWLAASYLSARCFVLPSAAASSSSSLFLLSFRFWAMECSWIIRLILEEKGWEVQFIYLCFLFLHSEFIHSSFYCCARLGFFLQMIRSVSNFSFSLTNWDLDLSLRLFFFFRLFIRLTVCLCFLFCFLFSEYGKVPRGLALLFALFWVIFSLSTSFWKKRVPEVLVCHKCFISIIYSCKYRLPSPVSICERWFFLWLVCVVIVYLTG